MSVSATPPSLSSKKQLPAYLQFTAGGIAGVTEILAMYPLDVVKTRFQLQVGTGGVDGYSSTLDCFSKMIRKEGISALYRGILAPVLVEAPKRATKFGANEFYGRLFMKTFSLSQITQPLTVLSGVCAGITEAFLIVSFELVKIQMQDRRNSLLYKRMSDVVTKIYLSEGFSGLSRGLEATTWRHAVWNGVYFGSIHYIKKIMPASDRSEILNRFVAGSIGGFMATTINCPFDVVKSRIQGRGIGEPVKYNWTLPAIRTIAVEEGTKALYKGYVPKVLRLGPGGGILLVVYEGVTEWMKMHLI